MQNPSVAQSVNKITNSRGFCRRPATPETIILGSVHRFLLFSNDVSESGCVSVVTCKRRRWLLFSWAFWRQLNCRRPVTETGSVWRVKQSTKIIIITIKIIKLFIYKHAYSAVQRPIIKQSRAKRQAKQTYCDMTPESRDSEVRMKV
jgi:hypothetical protein